MADSETPGLAAIWLRWKNASTSRTILGAAVLILFLDILVRVVAIGKELLVAATFGTGDALDAFLIAFMIPSFLINVIGGAFSGAVIPSYIRVKDLQGKESAQRLLSGMMLLAGAALLVAILVLAVLTPAVLPWLASGFSGPKLRLTRSLFYLLLPSILISSFSSIWASILNAGERFALVAFSGIAVPLFTMIVLLWKAPDWGPYALACGTMAGYLIEAMMIAAGLRKQGLRLLLRWTGFSPDLRQVVSQYGSALLGASLMSSALIVDQAMASMLPSGSVSALSYANKIVALPLSLAATALGVAVTPYFSKLVVSDQWTHLHTTVNHYLKGTFVLGVILVLGFVLFSKEIVGLLFERGSFDHQNTRLVARVLSCYAFQTPFYMAAILIVRLISSLRANHVLYRVSAVNVTVNIVLNYILMKTMGVAGIALSTSFVYLVSFSILFCYYRYRIGKQIGRTTENHIP